MTRGDRMVAGKDISRRFLEALGLAGRYITEIILTIRMDDAMRLRVKEYKLPRAPLVECEHEEVVTQSQIDGVEGVLVGLTRDELGFTHWGEFFPADQVEPTDLALALWGPAERLARAVLAGDRESALVLADMVRDLYLRQIGP